MEGRIENLVKKIERHNVQTQQHKDNINAQKTERFLRWMESEIEKALLQGKKYITWSESSVLRPEFINLLQKKGFVVTKKFTMNPSTHDDDLFCGYTISWK